MSTDKICKKCKRALPQTEYYTSAHGWNYVVCKDCCRAYGREQYARKHKSPYKYYYDTKKGCMVDNTGCRPKTYWSKDMLDILKKYYPVTPTQEVADMIGVHRRMCQRKAKELGFTKDPEYLRHSLSERQKIGRFRQKLNRAKTTYQKNETT